MQKEEGKTHTHFFLCFCVHRVNDALVASQQVNAHVGVRGAEDVLLRKVAPVEDLQSQQSRVLQRRRVALK